MTNQQQEQLGLKVEIDMLASRVEELIKVLKRVQADNHRLQLQQDQLAAEKLELRDRNHQAKRRIDLIVERLRGLESS